MIIGFVVSPNTVKRPRRFFKKESDALKYKKEVQEAGYEVKVRTVEKRASNTGPANSTGWRRGEENNMPGYGPIGARLIWGFSLLEGNNA